MRKGRGGRGKESMLVEKRGSRLMKRELQVRHRGKTGGGVR